MGVFFHTAPRQRMLGACASGLEKVVSILTIGEMPYNLNCSCNERVWSRSKEGRLDTFTMVLKGERSVNATFFPFTVGF